MSMTIERTPAFGTKAALRFVAAALGILAVWFAALAVLTAALEPEETVIAFGPEPRLFAALAGSDALLVSTGRGFIRLRGQSAGFVARLYRAGALLVLPGSAFGCGGGLVDARSPARTL